MLALLPCTRALKVSSSRASLLASTSSVACNADAAIGMQTEPTDGEKASDLLPKLARLPGAGDHFSEITNRACEIAT